MYLILVYDVDEKHCAKIMKIARKYLFHIQKSVFEGEITDSNYNKLVSEIDKVCKATDHVIFYKLVSEKVVTKEFINFKDISTII